MTLKPSWQLGWRTLWRDLRAGELRLLIVAVTLAVAALTAVGLLRRPAQGRAWRAMPRQLLGGDAVVSSDNPTPQAFIDKARALGPAGRRPRSTFPTMARAPDAQGGASKLVALEGRARRLSAARQPQVTGSPEAPGATTRDIPARGEAWVDAPLLDVLGLEDGRPAAAGRCAAAGRARDRDRAGPRHRLRQFRAARDDQRGRPARPAAGPAAPAGSSYRFAVAGADAQVAQLRRTGRWPKPRSRRCAACASSRSKAGAPKCGRRSTAPRNSSTWWRCWRRC